MAGVRGVRALLAGRSFLYPYRISTQNKAWCSSASMEHTVEHNRAKKEFVIKLSDSGQRALLQYEWVKPDLVDLYHTEVPEEFQGRGIAKYLAKDAFDFVVDSKCKMLLTCTYLQHYLRQNPLPQYTASVVQPDVTYIEH